MQVTPVEVAFTLGLLLGTVPLLGVLWYLARVDRQLAAIHDDIMAVADAVYEAPPPALYSVN